MRQSKIPLGTDFKKTRGYPTEARMKKGPVAVLECIEEIPCNPCEAICPFGAISIGKPITNVKTMLEDKCTGCRKCVGICPGLAIFVVDKSGRETGTVTLPYELLPPPKKGDIVDALDREGRKICTANVEVVVEPDKGHTLVVTVRVPLEFVEEVRNINLNGA